MAKASKNDLSSALKFQHWTKENIAIPKQPMRFYYNFKEREECRQGDLSTLRSIHHLIVTEKYRRKVELRVILPVLQWKTTQLVSWVGQVATWSGQITPKTANKANSGA